MIQKLIVVFSAVVFFLSIVAGVVWWVLISQDVLIGFDAEHPVQFAVFFVICGGSQIFSWCVLPLLLFRAWRTHSPWLFGLTPLLCLGLLFANLVYGFFTPALGAAFNIVIGIVGTIMLVVERRFHMHGETSLV